MKSLITRICIIAGMACGISGIASATAMGGAQLGPCAPAGQGGLSGVMITGTSITWEPGTLGNTGGCFITGTPTTITSTQPEILSGDTGNILNLASGGGAVTDFITFNGTNLDFVLTGFGATGTTSTACDTTVGDSCIVAAGSPFELKNTSGGVELDMTMLGTITDGGVLSDWSGLLTTQVSDQTTKGIQDELLGIGEAVTPVLGTYSLALSVTGGPVTPTPEPGTASMLFLAGTGMIVIRRKWFGKPHRS